MIVFMLVVIVVIAILLLVILGATRKRPHHLDIEKYRCEWLKIENSLDKKNLATFEMAIVSADKLLDQAMKDSGISGETMGDRLKNARGEFSNVDNVWRAHKLRNRIAHETDAKISPLMARKALATFKRSLKELGAI